MKQLIPRITVPTAVARRPRWQKWIAAVALGVVLLAIATDLASGILIRSKISSVASQHLHTHTDVSLGGSPALADVLNGNIPSASVHASSATVCSINGADITAKVTDLHRVPSGFAVSSTRAQITLDPASLTSMVAARLPSATAQPDPAHHTIDIHAGPADALTLALYPTLDHNRLNFKLTQATVLGRPLPTNLTDGLQDRLGHTTQLNDLPLGVSAEKVSVSPKGLEVSLAGGAWHERPHASGRLCSTSA